MAVDISKSTALTLEQLTRIRVFSITAHRQQYNIKIESKT